MKLVKKVLPAFFVLALAAGAVCAAESNYAGEALSIGVGARPLGMGGAFAAVADDASTSYWNPAGMTNIKGVEVSSVKLTKINDLDTKYSYVNLVYNAEKAGAFGVGWLRQAIGGIKISGISPSDEPLTLDELKENADNAVYFAYAYPIVDGFSMGTSIKLLLGNYPAFVYTGGGSDIAEATVNYFGYGFDLGLYFNLAAFVKDVNLSIGLNVQDIYTTIEWDEINGVTEGFTENVGINFKPGIAYRLPIQQFEIVAACDLDTRYEQMVIHAGGELWWNKMVGLRGGIKHWGAISEQDFAQEADWSIGASLRWYFIGVDYAYVYNELTPVQYISCLLYTSPSPRDRTRTRMPSSA